MRSFNTEEVVAQAWPTCRLCLAKDCFTKRAACPSHPAHSFLLARAISLNWLLRDGPMSC